MAKNRKNQSAEVRFGPALKAFLLCLLIVGAALGYLWQKQQINELGQQIRKRELRLVELRRQNQKLHEQLAWMHTTTFLEGRVKELNLGLVELSPSQIWYLEEPTPERNRPERQLAAQQTPPVALNE